MYWGFVGAFEKEGAFLSRSRLRLKYAQKVFLSEKIRATAGVSIGNFNYFLSSSTTSFGESDMAIDGNVGLKLEYKKVWVGASINQLFNNTVTLIKSPIELKRHSHVMFGGTILINEELDFSSISIVRLGLNAIVIDSKILVSYLKAIQIGTGYNTRQGIVLLAGIINHKVNEIRRLSLNIAYAIPVITDYDSGLNLMEFSISYQ